MRDFTLGLVALAALAFTTQKADAQVIIGGGYPAYNSYYYPGYAGYGYAAPAYGYRPYGGYGYGGTGISVNTGNFAFSYGQPAYYGGGFNRGYYGGGYNRGYYGGGYGGRRYR